MGTCSKLKWEGKGNNRHAIPAGKRNSVSRKNRRRKGLGSNPARKFNHFKPAGPVVKATKPAKKESSNGSGRAYVLNGYGSSNAPCRIITN
jgi:hypothetical protein